MSNAKKKTAKKRRAKKTAIATPAALRDILLSIARSVQPHRLELNP